MGAEDKQEIRKRVLALRRSLRAEEVEARSSRVLAGLTESGVLVEKRVVAIYAAADNEVRTRPLFDRLKVQGRTVVLPRVRGRGPELDFYPVSDWSVLRSSGLGIPEPPGKGEPMPAEVFDLVIVPGVAFDAEGGRLGYGMGCYDRVLGRLRPEVPRVGIGYDFQLVDRLPVEPHDLPLTLIVVERGVVLPGSRGVIK